MKGKDDIKDLFSKKLGSYEAKVNPELWEKVAAKVGVASSGGVVAGTSIAVKAAIGITVGTLLTVATVLLMQNKEESIQSKQAIQQVKVEDKPQEIPAPSNATSEVSVESKRENHNNTVNQIEINEDLPEIDVDTTYLSPIQKDHQLYFFEVQDIFCCTLL